MHTEEEFRLENEELKTAFLKRQAEYNNKTKTARGSQPPRMGRPKLCQKYLCPCWMLRNNNCPECKGRASRIQDPSGPSGSSVSACLVCLCTCSLGPFKNSDRGELTAAFQDYLGSKNDLPTVSEHRDTGLGNLNDLAQLALQV